MAYNDFEVFVLAPTQPDEKYASAKEEEKGKELEELKRNCALDIRYYRHKKASIFEKVIFTGGQGDESLSQCVTQLSVNKQATFVLTGHGSPGAGGKIGMGYDDQDHFNYRLSTSDLVDLLVEAGIKKLKALDLTFVFRCCNSGYAPLPAKEWSQKAEEKAIRDAQLAIAERSFIGNFYSRFSNKAKFSPNIVGFRGYYYPAEKTPQVSAKLNAKEKERLNAEDGAVTIQANWEVPLTTLQLAKLLKIQNAELDQLC